MRKAICQKEIAYNVVDPEWGTPFYHMASSMSMQDEPNPVLWLAIRVGKMELSYLLQTTHCVPQEKFPRKPYKKSFIGQACLGKMAGY